MVLSLSAGIGMRDPVPPDEPRFVLAAQHMVQSGQWLFPHRGSELYAEKPPVFMWMQAVAYRAVGDWQLAFLIPSLAAAIATLGLTYDLTRRLWGRRAARHATLGLFVCLQFGLQAKRGQIDMVLVALTTLSLFALVRYLVLERDARWLVLGTFAAGLGTITKGVGFLPLLVLPLWFLARPRQSRPTGRGRPGMHALAGVAGFIAGIGVWLLPMLAAVRASGDPALAAYAAELLWKQTGTRYADAWHHVKPPWYYLQVIATLWLPGALLLPWLVPAWWRRIARRDTRHVLLVGWSALVLLFFTLSPGKREVYVFPALPALCIAAGPLLPGLLRRIGARRMLAGYMWGIALVACALGLVLLMGPPDRIVALTANRGLEAADLVRCGAWLAALGAAAIAILTWQGQRRPGSSLVAITSVVWVVYGLGLMPATEGDSSARELMHAVRERIGPGGSLGLVAWREQHLLQAGAGTVEFGFKRPWQQQWAEAGAWLMQDPEARWVMAVDEALGPCIDREQASIAGHSNRREWWLVPGSAWKPGCTMPASGGEGTDGG